MLTRYDFCGSGAFDKALECVRAIHNQGYSYTLIATAATDTVIVLVGVTETSNGLENLENHARDTYDK